MPRGDERGKASQLNECVHRTLRPNPWLVFWLRLRFEGPWFVADLAAPLERLNAVLLDRKLRHRDSILFLLVIRDERSFAVCPGESGVHAAIRFPE